MPWYPSAARAPSPDPVSPFRQVLARAPPARSQTTTRQSGSTSLSIWSHPSASIPLAVLPAWIQSCSDDSITASPGTFQAPPSGPGREQSDEYGESSLAAERGQGDPAALQHAAAR